MILSIPANDLCSCANSAVGEVTRGRLIDCKQRPDIGAAVTASPAGKLGFEIRQPDIIGPTASVDHDRMRAVIIAAIDDEPGGAGLSHLACNVVRRATAN